MARDDTPLDQETFDRVLAEELGKGVDRRVAEGRARSAAVRAARGCAAGVGSEEDVGSADQSFTAIASGVCAVHNQVAAEIMRAVYFETLKRIERSGHDVFTARARVPKPRQALIAVRQWLWN